jgi:hypothetical protein
LHNRYSERRVKAELMVSIKGKTWYFRLKNDDNSLLQQEKPGPLITALSYALADGVHLLYSSFSSVDDFQLYNSALPPERRCFYEIIPGDSMQKPHFDIDVKKHEYPYDDYDTGSDGIYQAVIAACRRILDGFGIQLTARDILLFTSHGGPKRSYHVVINNYAHRNHNDAKAFYDKVVEVIANCKYTDYIDPAVYSSCQQFRIVGSRKHGSDRVKVATPFLFDGEVVAPELDDVSLLRSSLVTYACKCHILPSFHSPVPRHLSLVSYGNDDVDKALSFLRDKLPDCPFEYVGTKGPFIALKRTRPSICPLCEYTKTRMHEHDNSYITISKNGSVSWHCHRNKKQSLFLGKLTVPDQQPIPVQDDVATLMRAALGNSTRSQPRKIAPCSY